MRNVLAEARVHVRVGGAREPRHGVAGAIAGRARLVEDPAEEARARRLVDGKYYGGQQLTECEVLVGPARRGRLEEARVALEALFLDVISLPSDAPTRLAASRAQTGLRLRDCCVLLAAQDADASSILTFDDVLAREASRLGY